MDQQMIGSADDLQMVELIRSESEMGWIFHPII